MRCAARVLAAVLLPAVLVLLVACGSPAAGARVDVLWFGSAADGTAVRGVTEVRVQTQREPGAAPLVVDLDGSRRTGSVWHAAAWTAATVGTLMAAVPPGGLTVAYEVGESIDGPSGGAAMTVALLADLQGLALRSDVAVTGTVLPGGGIGPVGGIPEKVRAAREAGLSEVLIPFGQSVAWDPITRQDVDVVALGAELGVSVREALSVRAALAEMVVTPAPVSRSVDGPTGRLLVRLGEWAREALARVGALVIESAPQDSLARLQPWLAESLALALTRVPELLATDDAVAAFARATLAERTVLAWNARVGATSLAATDPERVREELAVQADRLAASANAEVSRLADTPTTSLEQLTALPDALCWGVDAAAVAADVAQSLRAGDFDADLGRAAADLAEARYNLDIYLPIAVEAVGLVGRTPMGEGTSERLAQYADLLADAGEANLAYADSLSETDAAVSGASAERGVAEQLRARWAGLDDQPGTQAVVVERVASALAFFVSGATLTAGHAATSSVGTGVGRAARVRVADQDFFANQVAVASDEVAIASAALARAGLDPSYVLWGSAWGRTTANAPYLSGVTDSLRLEGLQYQWYAGIGATMLEAVASAPMSTARSTSPS